MLLWSQNGLKTGQTETSFKTDTRKLSKPFSELL